MKILMNRKPVEGPWGGGNLFVKAFHQHGKHFGHKIVNEFSDDIDLIFMQDPRYSELGISINEIIKYKNWKPTTKVVHRVNECDARKNTNDVDHLLRECSKFTDKTIFVSNWMKEYHTTRGWLCGDTDVVINGVDHNIFKPGEKIQNKKVNIVAHHWSNNFMKGFDVYQKIDEFVGSNQDFTFTYIGRQNGTFKNTKIVDPLFGAELGDELGRYDLYISASRHDPGPNHILESLACKIPTYVHKDGGGCVEFAGEDMCFSDFDDLLKIIQSKKYNNNSFATHSWEKCMIECFEVIESLV
jgi:glycosyltransferase involved in cell wall biosynthesis